MGSENARQDNAIGLRLQDLRTAKGRNLGEKVTQQVVADALKVHVQTYGAWERGEQIPEGENLVRLADYYGVTPGEIVSASAVSRETGVVRETGPTYGTGPNRAYGLIAHLEVELGTETLGVVEAFAMAKDESERLAFNAEERQTIIEWMHRVVRRTSGAAAITIPTLKVTGRASVGGSGHVNASGFKTEADAAIAPPPTSEELEGAHQDAADAVHDADSPKPTTRKERPGRSAGGDRGA